MNTPELKSAIAEANKQLQSAIRDEDAFEIQLCASRIATLAVQLRDEDAVRQRLVDSKTASTWFARLRRVAA